MLRATKLVLIMAALVIAVSFTACANAPQQEAASSSATSQNSSPSSNNSTTSNSNNGLILVDQKVLGMEYGYFNTSFTVQNDTADCINTVTIDINELNENGDIISTTHPQEPTLVQPGQKLTIPCSHATSVDSVQAVQYSYNQGEDNQGAYIRGTFKNTDAMKLEYSSSSENESSTSTEQEAKPETSPEPKSEAPSTASNDAAPQQTSTTNTTPQPAINAKVTDQDMQGILLANAQAVVKDHLKSPSSAKFPWSFDEYKFIDKGSSSKHAGYNTYYIEGPVEAENSYGALLKGTFQVEIDYYKDSEDYFEVSCKINE